MSSQADGLASTTVHEIERFLDDRLVETDMPGGSVAVFDDDGIRYATGLGSRDLEKNAPATADTLYHVGSVTKILTVFKAEAHDFRRERKPTLTAAIDPR